MRAKIYHNISGESTTGAGLWPAGPAGCFPVDRMKRKDLARARLLDSGYRILYNSVP